MSQKSSVRQLPQFVPGALMSDNGSSRPKTAFHDHWRERRLSDRKAVIARRPGERPLLADTVEKLGTWAEVTLRVKH
jgi:hypothetical protein